MAGNGTTAWSTGLDLRGASLIERKRAPQNLLAKPPPKIVCVELFEMGDGDTLYRHACKLGLRGSSPTDAILPIARDGKRTGSSSSARGAPTSPSSSFIEKLGARPANRGAAPTRPCHLIGRS
jgi:bifunctional non-homologous end joining protein LigD